MPAPTRSGSERHMPIASVAALPTVSTRSSMGAESGTTRRASRVETAMSGRQTTRGTAASTECVPSCVVTVNPPRIEGATLSEWATPETTASPSAATGTSSDRESPRSYSSLSATAAPAALAADEPSPEAGRTPLSMWMRAGASRASTTAPTVFFFGSSGRYCAPTPVTSIVVSAAFSTVTTSAGRVRAAPNTSNPLPRFALVAGARTVTMAVSVSRGAKRSGIEQRRAGTTGGDGEPIEPSGWGAKGGEEERTGRRARRSAVGHRPQQRPDEDERDADQDVRFGHRRVRRDEENQPEAAEDGGDQSLGLQRHDSEERDDEPEQYDVPEMVVEQDRVDSQRREHSCPKVRGIRALKFRFSRDRRDRRPRVPTAPYKRRGETEDRATRSSHDPGGETRSGDPRARRRGG